MNLGQNNRGQYRQALVQYQGLSPSEQMVSGGHIVDIPESAFNGEFVDSLTRLTGVLSSGEPPRRVPSLGECRFCEITSRDCLDRMTEDSPREGVTGDF